MEKPPLGGSQSLGVGILGRQQFFPGDASIQIAEGVKLGVQWADNRRTAHGLGNDSKARVEVGGAGGTHVPKLSELAEAQIW